MNSESVSDFNELFKNNIDNYLKNILIFTPQDQWKINQINIIPKEEHLIWENLYKTTFPLAYKYGIPIYKEGIDFFISNISCFSKESPTLNTISEIMKKKTGWSITPVAGFVDEVIFFDLLSKSSFPSSDIIRLSKRFRLKYKNTKIINNLSYTPEPDIFHEIFGHGPFLTNQKYCTLFKKIGELGNEIINHSELSSELIQHNLKRLQNFVWWTLEFGIISNASSDYGFEILGAGILSSSDEINNVISCFNNKNETTELMKYDIEEVALTRFDYSKLQDRYFYLDSFEQLVSDFHNNKDLFFYKGN